MAARPPGAHNLLASTSVPVVAPVIALDGSNRVERDGLSVAMYPVAEGSLLEVSVTEQVEAAGRTLAGLHAALAVCPVEVVSDRDRPGVQRVHGDFRSANLVVANDDVVAVLDFDELQIADRITDLARSAVLLGTRYRDWAPTSRAVRARFLRAYDEVMPLDDRDWIRVDRAGAAVLSRLGSG